MNDIEFLNTKASDGDIQAVARCTEILECFSASTDGRLRTSEVVKATGLQRTTVNRYLASMTRSGMLVREADRRYTLGSVLRSVGRTALIEEDLIVAADGFMIPLRDAVGETAALSVWGGFSPVVIRVHVDQRRPAHVTLSVGASLPITTSQAQIFLAFNPDPGRVEALIQHMPEPSRRELVSHLADARQTGMASNVNAGVASGIGGLAAGIFGRNGETLAALALVGTLPSIQTSPDSHHSRALLEAAGRFSEYLGYSGAYPPRRIAGRTA